jgi:hypothetical protein
MNGIKGDAQQASVMEGKTHTRISLYARSHFPSTQSIKVRNVLPQDGLEVALADAARVYLSGPCPLCPLISV